MVVDACSWWLLLLVVVADGCCCRSLRMVVDDCCWTLLLESVPSTSNQGVVLNRFEGCKGIPCKSLQLLIRYERGKAKPTFSLWIPDTWHVRCRNVNVTLANQCRTCDSWHRWTLLGCNDFGSPFLAASKTAYEHEKGTFADLDPSAAHRFIFLVADWQRMHVSACVSTCQRRKDTRVRRQNPINLSNTWRGNLPL